MLAVGCLFLYNLFKNFKVTVIPEEGGKTAQQTVFKNFKVTVIPFKCSIWLNEDIDLKTSKLLLYKLKFKRY